MAQLISQVRYLGEMGTNLIGITKRLLANQDLLKLLFYTDKDPLSQPPVTKQEAYSQGYDGVVRIVPIIDDMVELSRSVITLRVLKGIPPTSNTEALDIYFAIEIFVPNSQWIIKNDNLRPYAIMGEIQKSLENKEINGLGKIKGAGFESNFFTKEVSCFVLKYQITQFN